MTFVCRDCVRFGLTVLVTWVTFVLLAGERGQTVEAQDTERSIFNKIDTDGDGLISFSEYVVVVLLLSIPEGEIHTVFDIMDLDDNGTLQLEEFLQVMPEGEISPARGGGEGEGG